MGGNDDLPEFLEISKDIHYKVKNQLVVQVIFRLINDDRRAALKQYDGNKGGASLARRQFDNGSRPDFCRKRNGVFS